jgi:hypothetical protein
LILSELSNATEERVLEYQAVDIETAHSVAEELDRRAESRGYRLVFEGSAIQIFSNIRPKYKTWLQLAASDPQTRHNVN